MVLSIHVSVFRPPPHCAVLFRICIPISDGASVQPPHSCRPRRQPPGPRPVPVFLPSSRLIGFLSLFQSLVCELTLLFWTTSSIVASASVLKSLPATTSLNIFSLSKSDFPLVNFPMCVYADEYLCVSQMEVPN